MKLVDRFWPFLKADYKSAEAYLEEQSKNGLHIISMDDYGITATYHKGEPKDLKYCIDYYADEIEELEGYLITLEDAGWNFVCNTDKILIFSSENGGNPPRIFTEKFEELRRVRKGLWKVDIPASIIALLLSALAFLPLAFDSELDRISSRILFGSLGGLGAVGLYRSLLFCIKSILAEKKNESMKFTSHRHSKFWGELMDLFRIGAGVGLFCRGLTKIQLAFIDGNYFAGICMATACAVLTFWLLSVNYVVNHCSEKTLKVIYKILSTIVFAGLLGYFLLNW